MAGEYLGWDVLYLEHRARRLERSVQRRDWRELHDPFDLHYREFIKLYRVNENIAMDLIDTLRPRLEREWPSGLSPERQVHVLLCVHLFQIIFYN